MRFRKYLFTLLAVLAMLWTLVWAVAIRDASEANVAAVEGQGSGAQLGASLGTGLAAGVTSNCTVVPGVFAAILFAILGYQNHKGLKKSKSEAETITEPLDPHLE